MPSSLVLSAYFAMLLSPCLATQWGDLLSVRWIFAFARRRRTHSAERLVLSFRAARFSAAVARETAYAIADNELLAAPRPFAVAQRATPVETAAFIEARQRVAARLGQLAVVQKLRAAAESVEAPKSAPSLAAPVVAPAAKHIRPRKPVPEVRYEPAVRQPAFASVQTPDTVSPEEAPQLLPNIAEVAAGPWSLPAASEAAASPPRYHRHGDSNIYEIAA